MNPGIQAIRSGDKESDDYWPLSYLCNGDRAYGSSSSLALHMIRSYPPIGILKQVLHECTALHQRNMEGCAMLKTKP